MRRGATCGDRESIEIEIEIEIETGASKLQAHGRLGTFARARLNIPPAGGLETDFDFDFDDDFDFVGPETSKSRLAF